MSSTGRKRMMFATAKSISALVLTCACLWGGYEVFSLWQENPAKVKSPVKSSPVKQIALRGENLILTQDWVARTLALPKTADLMELDLMALRDRLLASGQVKTAVVTRKFPDTLVVSIEERSPVVRVNAKFGESEAETFLVARDGVVFKGACYKDEVLSALPFLAGIALKRADGKLLPIDGMGAVADLLNTARADAPNLYRTWSIVSLEKFGVDGQIVVQATDAKEVIFGTRDDFRKQLARLDYILDESKTQPAALPIKAINLAVGGDQVPVSFEVPPAPVPEPGTSLKPKPNATRAAQQVATARPNAARSAPTRPAQANHISAQRSAPRRDF